MTAPTMRPPSSRPALAHAQSGAFLLEALVGVLISVTTVPAAANAAAAMAFGVWDEAVGSAVQLALNLSAIVIAGLLTLTIQRWFWGRREMRQTRDRSALGVAEAARRRSRGRSA